MAFLTVSAPLSERDTMASVTDWGWPDHYNMDRGPVWLYFVVDLWVQPQQKWQRDWLGKRCGPWYHYWYGYTRCWNDILPMVDNVETCGLYTRKMYAIEVWEWSEGMGWLPEDNI